MRNHRHLLVHIETPENAACVISKALRLRDFAGAKLTFIHTHYDHVVDDSELALSDADREEVVRLELEAERLKFQRFLASHAADENWQSHVVWARRAWQGVLEASEAYGADLIIKDAHARRGPGVPLLHSGHDWNLLGRARIPVMMLKPEPWPQAANVLAAIDVFDPRKAAQNAHILRFGADLTELLGGTLHVANALPLSHRIVAERRSRQEYDELCNEIAEQRRALLLEMLDVEWRDEVGVHVVTGTPHRVIADLCERLCCDFLVMGKSVPGGSDYLGTIAEQLLHHIDCDIASIT